MVDAGEAKTTFENPFYTHPDSTTSEIDLVEFKTFTKELIVLTLDLSELTEDTTITSYEKVGGSYENGETVTLIGVTSEVGTATGVVTVTANGEIDSIGSFGGTNSGYTDTETLIIIGQKTGASNARGTATVAATVITAVTLTIDGGVYELTDSAVFPTDFSTDIVKCTLDGGGNDMKITLTSGTSESLISNISAELRRTNRQ